MGKKRKHENGDSSEAKRIKNESHYDEDSTAEKVNNITIDDGGRYKVFLIKKPIEVSLDDLEALKWSNDAEVLSKSKIKTDSGTFRAIIAPKSKKERMVHIPAIQEREEGDSKNIKATNFVSGAITILPQEVKPKNLGGSIYEEGEEPLEDATIHPALKKIKKTAVLELDSRKQRNLAYGTSTDSIGNPRKLLNILKK